MKLELDTKPVYGDHDKYIKTKIKIYGGCVNTNFQDKSNTKRKSTIQFFITNNVRFCYQSKEKALSSKKSANINKTRY